ncbi:MAG: hypothetical protein EAZ55_09440 [Cytophagales bacterium]|nr:MAG: hypothetical protein EAZ55_09440 [Cytophagales bacterium]
MKSVIKIIGFSILLFNIYTPSKAQNYRQERTIGFQAGIANYFGDLNPLAQYVSTEIRFTRPSFGLNFTNTIGSTRRVNLRLGLVWARLQGDDFTAANPNDDQHRYRYIRNSHFRNDVYEFSLSFSYIVHEFKLKNASILHPYIMIGGGVFYHNPKARTPTEFGQEWVELQPLGTEGQGREGYDKKYSKWQVAIPFGIGAQYRLHKNSRWVFSFEMGMRYTFTDYIDDVSKSYADPNDLDDLTRAMANRTMEVNEALNGNSRVGERDRLLSIVGQTSYITRDGRVEPTFAGFGQKGDQRGNPLPDVYLFTAFHINYILNPKPLCPMPGMMRKGYRF